MQISCLNSGITALALLTLIGCSGARRQSPVGETVPARPMAVVVEREISGRVLGQTLSSPWGLAADRRGNVYLVDAGNNRLVVFDSQMTPLRDAGGYGSEQGLMDRPSFITSDNNLNLWVSDVGNRRICRFDNKLNFVNDILLRDDQDPLKYGVPSGIAVTAYGEVWMCDRETNRLAVFDNIGRFDRFLGDFGYSGGSLRTPEKIISGDDGYFYVCDAGNKRLAVFDEYGTYKRDMYNERFRYPRALAIDSSRLIWVLDSGAGLLYGLDNRGREMFVAGPMLPGSSFPLKDPADIVFTRDGRIVISDSGNNRLLICQITRASR
jgi:sugar lactone lactonase YvrE